jgi:hypothetical protein
MKAATIKKMMMIKFSLMLCLFICLLISPKVNYKASKEGNKK